MAKFIVPFFLGFSFGVGCLFPFLSFFREISALSAFLEQFPFDGLKVVCGYLGAVMMIYFSQDHFCKKIFSLQFHMGKDFVFMRRFLRILFLFVLIAVCFSSGFVSDDPGWMREMSREGYDFYLIFASNLDFKKMIFWIFVFCLLLLEWLTGHLILRWMTLLFPAAIFTVIFSQTLMPFFVKLLNLWIESDMAQIVFIALCGVLSGLMILWAVRKNEYRLPFVKIQFVNRSS